MKKNKYVIPAIRVSDVNIESLLYSESLGGGGQEGVEFGAKELFDDEEEAAPRSVWDEE